MVKHLITYILLGLFTSFSIFAEEDRQGVIVENQADALEKILESVPKTREVLTACREQAPPDLQECVWAGLTEQEQNQVIEALENYKRETTQTSGEENKYSYNLGNFTNKQLEAVDKLREYLGNRMKEIIYGEGNDPNVVVDHTRFYELYKSQMGKDLINQLSGYCLYSDPMTGLVPFFGEDRFSKLAFYKEHNLKNLGDISDNNMSTSYEGFNSCIQKINIDCQEKPTTVLIEDKDNPPNKKSVSRDQYFRDANPDNIIPLPSSEIVVSPCELSRYMTGVKLAMEKVDGINAAFAEEGRSQSWGDVKRFNSDKIVNIGSKELVEESGYKDAVEETAQRIQACADGGGNGCDEFLTDKEENQEIQDEFFIRNLAYKKKLEKMLTGEDVEVTEELLFEYFKEKGMTEESFQNLVANKQQEAASRNDGTTALDLIKEMIRTRETEEIDALQESLQARLEETQRATPEDLRRDPNFNPLATTMERVQNSAENLAEVIHYANIVSSFIEVGDPGNGNRNTNALAAELNNNLFEGGDRDVSSLQQFADPDNSEEEQENTTLDRDKIDQIQFGIGEPSAGSP